MNSVAVHELTNNTAPPSEWLADDFVSERRKSNARNSMSAGCLLLIGVMHTTVVDALPRRSLPECCINFRLSMRFATQYTGYFDQ